MVLWGPQPLGSSLAFPWGCGLRGPPGGGSSVRGGDPTASLKVPEAYPCGAESGVLGTSLEWLFHTCPGHLWPAQPILWHLLGGQGCRHPWVNWLRRPGPPSRPEAGRRRTQHSPNADPRLHDGRSVSLCGALEPAGSWGLGRPGLAWVVPWPESGVGSALSQWVPRKDVTSEGPAVSVLVAPSRGQSPLAGPGVRAGTGLPRRVPVPWDHVRLAAGALPLQTGVALLWPLLSSSFFFLVSSLPLLCETCCRRPFLPGLCWPECKSVPSSTARRNQFPSPKSTET